jgi:mono/diheme cytochrome c family protein
VTVIVLIIIGGAVFVFSGVYNVAADVPHWKITLLLLDKARDSSVSLHSGNINATLPVDQAAMEIGFKHYHEMCRLCHGGPGFHRTEFAEGLYPAPPSLDSLRIQEELGRAGVLWVVRHGIKMTGMPSFDKTHTDQQIRSIVAFVEKLPDISPKKYKEMLSSEGEGSSSADEQGNEAGQGDEQGHEEPH